MKWLPRLLFVFISATVLLLSAYIYEGRLSTESLLLFYLGVLLSFPTYLAGMTLVELIKNRRLDRNA